MNHCCCCDSGKWTSLQGAPNKSDLMEENVKTNGSGNLVEENVRGTDTKVPDYVRVLMVTDVNGRKKEMLIPAALDLERPKRPRTTFTESQLNILEQEFIQNHFITESKRQKLAGNLGLSETQIKVWFQNRRTKYRRAGKCPDSSTNLYTPTLEAKTDRMAPSYGVPFSWNQQPYPFPCTSFPTSTVLGLSAKK